MAKAIDTETVKGAVATLGVAALVAVASGGVPQASATLREACEAQLGHAMALRAASEGQRPALIRYRAEVMAAMRAGMLAEEIAYCLDLPTDQVRRLRDWKALDDIEAFD